MKRYVKDDRDWKHGMAGGGTGLFSALAELPDSTRAILDDIYGRDLSANLDSFMTTVTESDAVTFRSGDTGGRFGRKLISWVEGVVADDLRKRKLPYSLVCDLSWSFESVDDLVGDFAGDFDFRMFEPDEFDSLMEQMGAAAKRTLFRYALLMARDLVEARIHAMLPAENPDQPLIADIGRIQSGSDIIDGIAYQLWEEVWKQAQLRAIEDDDDADDLCDNIDRLLPAVPEAAVESARLIASRIEEANGKSLDELFAAAPHPDFELRRKRSDVDRRRYFGMDLAMNSLGKSYDCTGAVLAEAARICGVDADEIAAGLGFADFEQEAEGGGLRP